MGSCLACLDGQVVVFIGSSKSSIGWSFLWGHLVSLEEVSPISCVAAQLLVPRTEWGRAQGALTMWTVVLIFLGPLMVPFWSLLASLIS